MLSRLALALALTSGLIAQEVEEVRNEDLRRAREKAAGVKGEQPDKGGVEENLTPEQQLARNVTHGASRFCRLIAAVKPEKLMPGQSGVLMVCATMQGQAVLPSPAPIEMIGPLQQGLVTLGTLQVLPASNGTLASAYTGRPVYDNWAMMEVPVTMSPDAEVGRKQTVAVDVRFDLYDGSSAQPVGRFVDRAAVEIEVGRALDPEVVGGMPRPEPRTTTPAMTPRPTSTSVAPPEPTIEATPVLPREAPVLPSAQKPQAEEPQPAAGADDGPPLLMIAAVGAVLVLLILLLVRRK